MDNKKQITFFSKVKSSTPDECWEWQGYLKPNGYGEFRNGFLGERSCHRISYTFWFGSIPKGLCVCHKCDNRKCVNPLHLFIGTHKENTHDMHLKGRNFKPNVSKMHCPKGHPYSGKNLILRKYVTVVTKKESYRRSCRTCLNDLKRKITAKNKKVKIKSEFCKHGHKWSENTVIRKDGKVVCRRCINEGSRRLKRLKRHEVR